MNVAVAHVVINPDHELTTTRMQEASKRIDVYRKAFNECGVPTVSVFQPRSEDLDVVVERAGANVHLVSGFDASDDVERYVMHALQQGLHVIVLDNCVSNSTSAIFEGASKLTTLENLQEAGAKIMTADAALKYTIRHAQNPAALPA